MQEQLFPRGNSRQFVKDKKIILKASMQHEHDTFSSVI